MSCLPLYGVYGLSFLLLIFPIYQICQLVSQGCNSYSSNWWYGDFNPDDDKPAWLESNHFPLFAALDKKHRSGTDMHSHFEYELCECLKKSHLKTYAKADGCDVEWMYED